MDRGIGKRMRFRLFFVKVWEIYNRVEIPGLRNYLINNFSALDIRVDKGALAENFVGEKKVDETMVKFIPIVYF